MGGDAGRSADLVDAFELCGLAAEAAAEEAATIGLRCVCAEACWASRPSPAGLLRPGEGVGVPASSWAYKTSSE
jgi:hypothetical protein